MVCFPFPRCLEVPLKISGHSQIQQRAFIVLACVKEFTINVWRRIDFLCFGKFAKVEGVTWKIVTVMKKIRSSSAKSYHSLAPNVLSLTHDIVKRSHHWQTSKENMNKIWKCRHDQTYSPALVTNRKKNIWTKKEGSRKPPALSNLRKLWNTSRLIFLDSNGKSSLPPLFKASHWSIQWRKHKLKKAQLSCGQAAD